MQRLQISRRFDRTQWRDFLKERRNPITDDPLPKPTFVTPEDRVELWTGFETPDEPALWLIRESDHFQVHGLGPDPIPVKEAEEGQIINVTIREGSKGIITGAWYRLQEASVVLCGLSLDRLTWEWHLYICNTDPTSWLADLIQGPLELDGKDTKDAPTDPLELKVHV